MNLKFSANCVINLDTVRLIVLIIRETGGTQGTQGAFPWVDGNEPAPEESGP